MNVLLELIGLVHGNRLCTCFGCAFVYHVVFKKDGICTRTTWVAHWILVICGLLVLMVDKCRACLSHNRRVFSVSSISVYVSRYTVTKLYLRDVLLYHHICKFKIFMPSMWD